MTRLAAGLCVCASLALLGPSALGQDPVPPVASSPPLDQQLSPGQEGSALASEARRHFDRGVQLYSEGEFAVALVEFERAYELLPNVRVLYNIAQLSFQLQKFARARAALQRYLLEAADQLPPGRRESVERDLAALELRTGTLRLRVNVPGAQVMIDGVPARFWGPQGFVIDAGERSIRVDKPGYRSMEKHVSVAGGDQLDWLIELTPLLPPGPPQVTASREELAAVPLWLPWAITGALAAGWATTGLFALDAQADKDALEQDPAASAAALDDAVGSLKTLAIVTDVLLGATIAAAGVSAYWTLSSDSRRSAAPPAGVRSGALSLQLSGRW